MTDEEIETEYHYRIEERLGMLCGDQLPTPEQISIAASEADGWRKAMKESRAAQ